MAVRSPCEPIQRRQPKVEAIYASTTLYEWNNPMREIASRTTGTIKSTLFVDDKPERIDVLHDTVQRAVSCADQVLIGVATNREELDMMMAQVAAAFLNKLVISTTQEFAKKTMASTVVEGKECVNANCRV
jgi:hypothetical protein